MAEPGDVAARQVDDVRVLQMSFEGYNMCKYTLCLVASYDEALDDLASLALIVELSIALIIIIIRPLQLITSLDPAGRDVPKVYPYDRDGMFSARVSSSLLTKAPSLVTIAAPGTIRHVRYAMFFNISSRWEDGRCGSAHWFHLLVLVSVHALVA